MPKKPEKPGTSKPANDLENLPIDGKKAKAIQRCVDNGELKVSMNKVDLQTGKIGEAWLYD